MIQEGIVLLLKAEWPHAEFVQVFKGMIYLRCTTPIHLEGHVTEAKPNGLQILVPEKAFKLPPKVSLPLVSPLRVKRPNPPPIKGRPNKICRIRGCKKLNKSRGVCVAHLTKFRRAWREGYILEKDVVAQGWIDPVNKGPLQDRCSLTNDARAFFTKLRIPIQPEKDWK